MSIRGGRTLTIFVILIIVLLVSSTSIGFYLYHLEKRMLKNIERQLDSANAEGVKLQAQMKDLQGQLALSQDKNKEADQKINNLLDEEDLNEGLRAALKKENAGLKSQLENLTQAGQNMKADLDTANVKLSQFQDLLKTSQDKAAVLEARLSKLTETNRQMQDKLNALNSGSPGQEASTAQPAPSGGKGAMELGKIVVGPPSGATQGKILSVDTDADFVIFNLGLKEGVKPDAVLSVYRGTRYLGDIKAARVQDEMAAADIVPPLTGKDIQKNDTVVLKP
ncbi:MAG: hypothetical protein KGJ09_02690 [Candidatus Omnitrophica bacterium]|nr:hypothetical protein [Candidatus Omnitrophota bacterium]MDE2008967.1 hypothetical protein [Candidatus Omnitrophota bacterium]MDE2214491.1 hypothetical protein [Candidatus Omnitrophota bacterium]MDE2230809.1 hypothetical protein [Candidatus Omnitrophota bacterium]